MWLRGSLTCAGYRLFRYCQLGVRSIHTSGRLPTPMLCKEALIPLSKLKQNCAWVCSWIHVRGRHCLRLWEEILAMGL